MATKQNRVTSTLLLKQILKMTEGKKKDGENEPINLYFSLQVLSSQRACERAIFKISDQKILKRIRKLELST